MCMYAAGIMPPTHPCTRVLWYSAPTAYAQQCSIARSCLTALCVVLHGFEAFQTYRLQQSLDKKQQL